MANDYKTLLFDVSDGLAILTLNRPEKLNSFNTLMFSELKPVFQHLSDTQNKIRCLVITGAGRAFCAGQDLDDRAVKPGASMPDLSASLENNYNPLIRAIRQLTMPVICAVNGTAAGAGSSLALACDIVLAARSASFIQSFCKIGVVPDSGASWSLPHRVGVSRAMALALLGEKLPAIKAEQWGLIYKCVDDDELIDAARRMGQYFTRQPTKGLALTKQAILSATHNSFDQQLDLERDLQGQAGRTRDYAEGVAAFIAKREPVFCGE